MNAREVVRLLKAAGWIEARSKGSHLQMKHPTKGDLVTVPVHGSRDLKSGTLASIERQAGMKLRRR
ncbi:MAG: type II toxin-antitoxin system HicA family toxin [Proteobacteria bacterium]|nr:type II toxin-antitoxin system HicA family toxin [Pseudomonadota bacterium]